MFNINFADDWIQTADLWNRKQPLYQLSHNHFPILSKFDALKHLVNESERRSSSEVGGNQKLHEHEPPPVWPDWAIFCTLGNFLKPLAKINLAKSPTFFGNFCKGVKISHFSSEIILGNFYRHLMIFSGHTGLLR